MTAARLRVDVTTPVVVLQLAANPFHHGALGIARSLGRLGVEVAVVSQRKPIEAHSRFVTAWVRLDERDVVSQLAEVGGRFDGRAPILLTTDDEGSRLIDGERTAIRRHYLLPEQPAELAAKLSDKRRLQQLCREHGIATPDGFAPSDRDEVIAFARNAAFPVVVKRARAWVRSDSGDASSVVLARTKQDLLDAFDLMKTASSPNVLLQEYVPGRPESIWMFNGYFDRSSECLFGMTGRKIRQLPRGTGATTLGEAAHNEEVLAHATTFMRAVGYRGIVDMGFRFDARDGTYRLLDVNPRIGATFRLFVSGELDVARALYLDLTSQAVPAGAEVPPRSRRWLVEPLDAMSAWGAYRAGELTPHEWLRSLAGIDEVAVLARDDLEPAIRTALHFGGRAARRGFRSVRRRP